MKNNNIIRTEAQEYRIGIIAALSCAVLWGFLPIYWQALRPIDSFVIIYYRIFLVALVCFLIALKLYGLKGIIEPLKDKRIVLRYFTAGIVITLNWSLYIWAVNADFVIHTAIGYYIEPLFVCVFGILLFKEKLTGYKKIAILMALIGLIVLLIHFRQLPFIAMGIAMTFATYAAIKKGNRFDAVLSLLYETMFLAPPALIVVIVLECQGKGAFHLAAPYQLVMLFLIGMMTAVPLGLFAMGANRLPLVTLGIIEYISPSITLIIGIFMFKEPFDLGQFLAFCIIWIGLVFFTIGEMKEARQLKDDK
ncbi:MAG: EamA family transporter RarD [Anaerovoracaceae bacterium]|nr:EamA family transporter RarD [Clostridiales bacterium]